MARIRNLDRPTDPDALILYWPEPTATLWDATVSEMVEALEHELGVVVTVAQPAGAAPALRDAAAAATFLGCGRVVVAAAEGHGPTDLERAQLAGRVAAAPVVPVSTWSAAEIARSFRAASRLEARAA
jgi:hypothetical protein